jgi:hypothetical protein
VERWERWILLDVAKVENMLGKLSAYDGGNFGDIYTHHRSRHEGKRHRMMDRVTLLALIVCWIALVIIAIAYVAPVMLEPKPAYVAPLKYDPADSDMDGVISMTELMTVIEWYYEGNYRQDALDVTIERWQAGVYAQPPSE